MNHRERFLATIERRPVDRPASWLGMPMSTSLQPLFDYFKVSGLDALKKMLDDDIYPVDVPYHSPSGNHIACAFPFAKKDAPDYEHRTLTTPGYFEKISDPAKVAKFPWPDPALYMKPEECKAAVERIPKGYAALGVLWSAHFQDACAAFGMANAFTTMLRYPRMFQAVIGRILEFYLQANEIFLKATAGKLDAVLIGNDFGGQSGLMVAQRHIQKYILPGTRKLIQQAKKYGVKVIHHSCGSIFELIPDLIDCGADVIHPIQALAQDMDAVQLKKAYREKVSFCGGVDTQQLLVHGSPKDVKNKIAELKRIFPTGLIISPSHEALMPDVPPANVAAMFEAINALN